jgi:pilus assembly protein CpaB
MNRSRIAITFMLALIIAGLASLLVSKQLTRGKVNANVATVRVVMAARDLEVGVKLAEEDLRLADWAVGTPPKECFLNLKDAVGRAVLYPTFKDEIILGSRLASVGAGAGMSAVIPPGMRAVSIRVDDVVAVAGFVGPGSRVDVLLTGVPGTTGQQEIETKSILENVQVLAAGQKIQPDSQGRPDKVNVVTLLCNIEDASKVTLASSEGRIQLVLRNPTDTVKTKDLKAVGRRALFGGTAPAPPPAKVVVRRVPAPAAVPPPPPPAPPIVTFATVEILSGGKKSVVQLGTPAAEAGGVR